MLPVGLSMAQAQSAVVERLPKQAQSDARAYVEDGRTPSGFFAKVLANDFCGALGRADASNKAAIDDWAKWLFNDIPAGAWGDRQTVIEWCESGGLNG